MSKIRSVEGRYEGFEVYDERGKKVGRTSAAAFVDTSDGEEYVSVEMGLLGRRSVLIPAQLIRVKEDEKIMEVAEPESRVRDAPSFGSDEEVTPELVFRIRSHFGLESAEDEKYRGSAAHIQEVQREEGTGRAPKPSEDVGSSGEDQ